MCVFVCVSVCVCVVCMCVGACVWCVCVCGGCVCVVFMAPGLFSALTDWRESSARQMGSTFVCWYNYLSLCGSI